VQLIKFRVQGNERSIDVDELVIAGWSGRDTAIVGKHIAELEAIGVHRPRTTPMFYRAGANLLSTAEDHDVLGAASSGEVEVVLISTPDGIMVGVGSDHTDRQVEKFDIAVAKQMCPKPLGRELWPLRQLIHSWDHLELRSWVTEGGQRRLYQEGTMANLLPPGELIRRLRGEELLEPGTALFTGTLPVMGKITGGEMFEMELVNPLNGVRLTHQYAVRHLPWVQ
jgi:hypothetical protein